MTTISDENGIINNFAKEPQMYYAEAPTTKEQKSYIVWGAIAFLVTAGSVFTAISVS
ncbi:ssl1498 family light-harvesting-like protein [Waterburya agarophytonicola K14]|uniref:Ssl1498 family light-harvesting-like protein n=1 Tax=Waterburya agarophytonicola KI4 TaxID=2874699 RepID=A0A964BNR2_9CYAN|nr:ssl1498 family light-harvesting-like protein [Waterburya agarophytonicola]MCC0176625.1 ssl1498 family light-harvesting-like protein [Waterburya agarophytonicola KI4]